MVPRRELAIAKQMNLILPDIVRPYLGARYRYLRAKLGGLKAVKAMARVLACLYYRLVTKGQVWVDRGTAEFEQRRQQRDLATLQRKARSLGLQLVPAA
jgi:transposase